MEIVESHSGKFEASMDDVKRIVKEKHNEMLEIMHENLKELSQGQSDLLKRVYQQNKAIKSFITVMNQFDTKVQSLLDVLVSKDLLTEREFEDEFDNQSGWRRREAGELIVDGDVCWVDYKVTMEGSPDTQMVENVPVKVGAGALSFEKDIVGKTVGSKFPHSLEQEGHKWVLNIEVKKVKYKLGGKNGTEEKRADGAPVGADGETSDGHRVDSTPNASGAESDAGGFSDGEQTDSYDISSDGESGPEVTV